MKRLVVAAVFLTACTGSAEERALSECKGAYDRYMRWTQTHWRHPETPSERAEIVPEGKRDPWGTPYVLEVEDGRPSVWSHGPDKRPHTADDIRFPPE